MINDVATGKLDVIAPKMKAQAPRAAGGQNFDQFMANMDSARDNQVAPRERDRNHRDADRAANERMRDRSSDSSRQASSEEPELRQVQEPDNGPAEHYEAAGYGENNEISEEVVEYIVEAVAAIAYVPYEAVVEALETLEVKPEEIAQPKEANKLLQNLFKVESPVVLLNIPEYQDILKEVAETVEKIAETGEPAAQKATVDLERLSGLTAKVNQQNQVVVEAEAPKVEALQEKDLQMMQDNNQPDTSGRAAAQASGTVVETSTQEAGAAFKEVGEIIPEAKEIVQPQAVPAAVAAQQIAAAQVQAQPAHVAAADPVQVMAQIMTKVKTVSAENFAELRIQLRPEHLGDVTLRVTTQNGIVAAMFVAENQRIKEILEAQLRELRDALEEQGIEVSQLFVSVGSEDAERQMNEFLKAQQESLRRLQRAAGIVSDAEEEEPIPDEPILMDNTVEFTA